MEAERDKDTHNNYARENLLQHKTITQTQTRHQLSEDLQTPTGTQPPLLLLEQLGLVFLFINPQCVKYTLAHENTVTQKVFSFPVQPKYT